MSAYNSRKEYIERTGKKVESYITLSAVHTIRQEQEQEIRGKIDREHNLTSWRACMSDKGQKDRGYKFTDSGNTRL